MRSRRRRLARRGYAVLRGFLNPAEVEAARAGAAGLTPATAAPACARPHNLLFPLRFDDRLVDLFLGDAARRDRIGGVTAASDLRFISAYLSVKEPGSGALWWHQDWWCWDHPVTYHRPAPQVAVLCALHDTDRRHGGLRVLPGSHARSVPLHALLPDGHADDRHADDHSHPVVRDHPDQVTVALRAGDAVVLDYRLLHGTHPHGGEARRDCVLLTFTPAWAALPRDIRGHLIRHPALPADGDAPSTVSWAGTLLPAFDGFRRDLPLSRDAPASFLLGHRPTCLAPPGNPQRPANVRTP